MLTESSEEFFAAFGFVVADSGVLGDALPQLRVESERAIARAYPLDPGRTLLLPAMSEEHSRHSLSVLHDPRLTGTAERLLGDRVLVKPPKITRFAVPTNWHRDCYMPLRGVKVATYFGDHGTTPFHLVPGSHRGPARRYVDRLFGRTTVRRPSSSDRDPTRVLPPGVPVHTVHLEPGQLLMFDLGLWHANLSADRRLQWAVTYLAVPRDPGTVDETALHLAEFYEYTIPYPAEEFPYFPASWHRKESGSELFRAASDSGVWDRFLELRPDRSWGGAE
ncbi:hypothetical protein SAMN05216371_8172 [Streptomyces sp. TLI_053]|uniref:hypothetical protein n=1 Tax=Streptomyces sp. TLI_053 TaxID=1855352 RepID=UPI00087CBC48|nr:hypothetical protein [Streptomyces sp. TLI_053]SDT83351.1 hypothetical protein SAMN05216371_8172 [Streptomyces sp. TLI_053]